MTIKEIYSKENTRLKLIEKIEKSFGKDHKIKTAIFKAVSEYNDEYDNYNPILILIDDTYNEVDHKIRLYDLCPSDEEQYDNDTDECISLSDITIKF